MCITAPSHAEVSCCAEPQQRSTKKCIEHSQVGCRCVGCTGCALGHRSRAAWPARWDSTPLWRPGTVHIVRTLKWLKCVKGKWCSTTLSIFSTFQPTCLVAWLPKDCQTWFIVDDFDHFRTCKNLLQARTQTVATPSHKSY